MKITIDTETLPALVEQSGKFVFQQDSEEVIVRLLEIQDAVNEAISQVQSLMVDKMGEVPGLTTIVGDKVKVQLRKFGPRYTYDESKTDQLKGGGFLKETTKYQLDAKAVAASDTLPEGVTECERRKQVVIRRR